MHKLGKNQKKLMLILLGGLALGLAGSPRRYFYTFNIIKREWKSIDKRSFNEAARTLSREKLIKEERLPDGSLKLTLTKSGKKEASLLRLLDKSVNFVKSKKWDKKWRIVAFDIPEKDRIFRNILRKHLFNLSFYKLQNSVFVSPYPCEKLIKDLINLYSANSYVKVITAIKIDDEKKLKKQFSIK